MRALLVVVGLSLFAAPTGDGCVGNCGGSGASDGSGVSATVFETSSDSTSGSGGGASRFTSCEWEHVEPGDPTPLWFDEIRLTVTLDEPHWAAWCGDGVGDWWLFPVGDPLPDDLVDAVISDAYERTPVVAFHPYSAPTGDEVVPLVVRFPTSLFVDEGAWVPVSATASIPPLTVTTTATPVEITWSGGDAPEVVICAGPGSADDRAECVTEFHESSAAGVQRLSASVRWEVVFVCSAQCGSGVLPDLVTVSEREVVVAEVQALVSEWGTS